jgi:hypothetical protein
MAFPGIFFHNTVGQIVFFEMNHPFTTGAERVAVLEDLRKPDIVFPAAWRPHLTRQRQGCYHIFLEPHSQE